MENNITSLEEIIKNANKRLDEKDYFTHMIIKPLKDVAKDKGVVLADPNFDSGIYLFEQAYLEYNIDKRTALVGIFNDYDRQTIRNQYFDARTEIVQLVTKRDTMQKLTPNLQKMLSSDILTSSLSDYGLCYDFSKIKKLVENNQFEEAENMASRDWFFMRTLNYFFRAKKIANNLGMPVTKENVKKVNGVMAQILNQKDFNGKEFPKDFKVNFKNQQEKKIVYVDRDINQDLEKIEKACLNKPVRTF